MFYITGSLTALEVTPIGQASQIFDQAVKDLSWTKALAYLASSSLTKKKSFITTKPGPNVINLFTVIIYEFL
jgi:hypothetical protein